jgi:hypothetical protein
MLVWGVSLEYHVCRCIPELHTTRESEWIDSSEANRRVAVTDSWLNVLTPPTPAEGLGIYPWHPSTVESVLVNSGIADGLSQEDAETETKQWELEDASDAVKDHLARIHCVQ